MNRVPNREMQRREYLKKKSRAYVAAIVFFALFTLFLVLAVGGVAYFVPFFARSLSHPSLDSVFAWIGIAFGLLLALTFGGIWLLAGLSIPRAASKIPYVPPVTIDTLPPEEILVRGATEHAVVQSNLLRPTMKDQENKAEELLRSVEE